jgi:hypothetical protein
VAATDRGVVAFGDAPFEGPTGGAALQAWSSIVPAIAHCVAGRSDSVTVAVEDLDGGPNL